MQAGDTLSGIAAGHGTSVAAIAELNAIDDPNLIYAGQRLELPGSQAVAAAAAVHTISAGETLSGIAARYGVGVDDLAGANAIADPDRITAGQRLTVPGGAAQPAAVSRAEAEALLTSTAQRYGWSTAFVKAVAWQESGWSNSVVSSAGAIGIMQVLPETGEFVGRYRLGRILDLHDPADNVEAGVAFLDYLHAETGGDPQLILAAYFQGLRSVSRDGIRPATQRYIDNVLALKPGFQ